VLTSSYLASTVSLACAVLPPRTILTTIFQDPDMEKFTFVLYCFPVNVALVLYFIGGIPGMAGMEYSMETLASATSAPAPSFTETDRLLSPVVGGFLSMVTTTV